MANPAAGARAEVRVQDLAEALRRAMAPYFTTVGKAFAIIEDRQLELQRAVKDLRRRIDALSPGAVSQVEQPLQPPLEHLFNRIEDSQAMMEKLIGELAMRVNPEGRRPQQPW